MSVEQTLRVSQSYFYFNIHNIGVYVLYANYIEFNLPSFSVEDVVLMQ